MVGHVPMSICHKLALAWCSATGLKGGLQKLTQQYVSINPANPAPGLQASTEASSSACHTCIGLQPPPPLHARTGMYASTVLECVHA